MLLPPPRSTRTATLLPYTALVLSCDEDFPRAPDIVARRRRIDFVFIGRHGPCECDEAVLAVEDKRRPLQFGDADWTESSLGIFRYVLAGRLPKQEGAERVAFDDRRPEGDDILFGPDIGSLKCGRYRAEIGSAHV